MTIKRTLPHRARCGVSAIAITALLGTSALAPGALARTSGGSGGGGTWAPLPQGPCSPGGIWHPDPGGNGMSGWCEYPKKKCWWSCPKPTSSSTSGVQATRY